MNEVTPLSPARIWTARILSGLVVALLLLGVAMSFFGGPQVTEPFTSKYGYPASARIPLALAELLCAVLYAVPQTSVLGAVLLTGYLGGAVSTHVRVGEPFFMAIIVAVVAWAGIYLRERRLADVLPLRK